MATDGEIIRMWESLPKDLKPQEAAAQLYRIAQEAGKKDCLAALEKELLSDATIEEATGLFFGLGRYKKAGTITQKAIMREAFRLAKEKARK